MPRAPDGRFYIQFVQKDRADLEEVRSYLVSLRVDCGLIHNPSRAIDPGYWRLLLRSRSWSRFAAQVGSWHPRKIAILDRRLPAAMDDRERMRFSARAGVSGLPLAVGRGMACSHSRRAPCGRT